MNTPRYLTKSRFKLACECPTKLFYTAKGSVYANQAVDDPFLLALADGGFQVGELAKCYFPYGVEVTILNYEDAERQTVELLEHDKVVIFEAAIRFENLFIRADILVKNGDNLRLIEVKSKSWDPAKDTFVSQKTGTIKSEWKPYLYDVAFQKYVVEHAFPNAVVSASLMMTDKTSLCPTDGLHQKIRITKDENGRKRAKLTEPLTEADLSTRILCEVLVNDCCDVIFAGTDTQPPDPKSFEERVEFYANMYARDEKITSPITSACKKCEFRTTPEDSALGLKSGLTECWGAALSWSPEECEEQTVLDVWDYRKKDKSIKEGRIKLVDIDEDDISPEEDGKPGLSRTQRQWIQIEKARNGDVESFIDIGNLEREMNKWKFPLHFIDFETATPAIPFNRGRHPYEGIAFQFSHHIVHDDGRVEHAGEYINTQTGKFPNFDFIRALKSQLETDNGSIFRYADHENSYVNMIARQLLSYEDHMPDRDDLLAFIKSISKSTKDSSEAWEGDRSMIDMLALVKRYYYDPRMKGSNSIKQVLPAILNSSDCLQEKYSRPIYGADGGIPSSNFANWTWVHSVDGEVTDPYKLLPRMFQDVSENDLELLSDDEIRDGGAAMTAYARLQFEDMSEYERSEIRKALLQYCELDTMAMVMIFEGWKDILAR